MPCPLRRTGLDPRKRYFFHFFLSFNPRAARPDLMHRHSRGMVLRRTLQCRRRRIPLRRRHRSFPLASPSPLDAPRSARKRSQTRQCSCGVLPSLLTLLGRSEAGIKATRRCGSESYIYNAKFGMATLRHPISFVRIHPITTSSQYAGDARGPRSCGGRCRLNSTVSLPRLDSRREGRDAQRPSWHLGLDRDGDVLCSWVNR